MKTIFNKRNREERDDFELSESLGEGGMREKADECGFSEPLK